jgi:hypothetical protein
MKFCAFLLAILPKVTTPTFLSRIKELLPSLSASPCYLAKSVSRMILEVATA